MSNLASAIKALKPKKEYSIIIRNLILSEVKVDAEDEETARDLAMKEYENGHANKVGDKDIEIIEVTTT